jgi:hypothetical protein
MSDPLLRIGVRRIISSIFVIVGMALASYGGAIFGRTFDK